MQQQSYDLIVVGTGTAGAILAARIAEHGVNPKTGEPLRVAAIEAGPYWKGDQRPGYGIPLRRRMITNLTDRDSVDPYRWPSGYAKIVGGSSVHNGNASLLPFDTDYLRWQNETGVDWTKDNFREAVAEIVEMFNYHQAPDATLNKGNLLFRDAVRQLGYSPTRFPMARRNCIYCGYCGDGFMCKYDSKASGFVYVSIAEKYGVEIIPETEVTKVLIEKKGEKGRVTGIEFRRRGQVGELRAPKVLVCCSNFNTPVLLMRSGYGPKDLLGNNVIVENSNVGAHYSTDSGFTLNAFSDERLLEPGHGTNNGDYIVDSGMPNGDYDLMISSNFISRHREPIEAVLSEFAPAFGREHKDYMRTALTRLAGIIMLQTEPTTSRGRVYPDGKVTYTEDPKVPKRLKEGVEVARSIFNKMGIKRVSQAQDLNERVRTAQAVPRTVRPAWHGMGTCRAGVDRKDSVANPRFASHDVEGLLIGSGAVVPRCGSSEAWIPIAVVAAFAWRRIVQDHFSKV